MNIKRLTLQNTYYRDVIETKSYAQLVLMSLKPGENIPWETHYGVDQFIRVEKGNGIVIMIMPDTKEKRIIKLNDDDYVIIPSGAKHYVENTSDYETLKLYTIYTSKEHFDESTEIRQGDDPAIINSKINKEKEEEESIKDEKDMYFTI